MSSTVATESAIARPDITKSDVTGPGGSGGAPARRPTGEERTFAEQHESSPLKTLLFSGLLLLPFWMIPIAHLLSSPDTATGLFQYELPYYVANGRAAFERGDGIFYPNPYDPSPNAPVIYAHWLPWVLGWLTAKCSADPGDTILAVTFFASLMFAVATRTLVRQRLGTGQGTGPSKGTERVAWMTAMWGGGLLSFAGLLLPTPTGTAGIETLLRFDPGNGLWFLNWGRNALFPTEAVYHTLVAVCWVFELRERRGISTACLLFLATTHPWSGIELLLTIMFWRTVQLLRRRNRSSAAWWLLCGSLMAGFLAYYKIWLPSFPEHAELQSVWELDWSLSWTTAIPAYGPISVAALLYVTGRMKSGSCSGSDQFLLCAFVVAAGLAFHDRLIAPVQPLHFTRGYVWMPLFLLALPKLTEWWQRAWSRSLSARVLAVTLVAMLCSDNAAFSIVHTIRQYSGKDGFYLTADDRALLHDLPEKCPGAVVLTESETLNYLAPAYGGVRPWLGHHFNTPQFPVRRERFEAGFPGSRVSVSQIPPEVDVLLIRRDRDASALADSGRWIDIDLHNAGWSAWLRL
ncbi:MAG: hypothetical protein R3C19_04815 [Planctomycetaceae bacterium]